MQPGHYQPGCPQSQPALETEETHRLHLRPDRELRRGAASLPPESCQFANIHLKKSAETLQSAVQSPHSWGASCLGHHMYPQNARFQTPAPSSLRLRLPRASQDFKEIVFSETISASTVERRHKCKVSIKVGGAVVCFKVITLRHLLFITYS